MSAGKAMLAPLSCGPLEDSLGFAAIGILALARSRHPGLCSPGQSSFTSPRPARVLNDALYGLVRAGYLTTVPTGSPADLAAASPSRRQASRPDPTRPRGGDRSTRKLAETPPPQRRDPLPASRPSTRKAGDSNATANRHP